MTRSSASAEGFAGRMAANAFEEFWPDVKSHVFHKREDSRTFRSGANRKRPDK